MAFILKDKIFGFFGSAEARRDTYKDRFTTGALAGKGIQQRFQELCAEEYDTYLQPTLDNFPGLFLDVNQMDSNLIALVEAELGLEFMAIAPIEIRRKAINFHTALVGVKGTTKGFKTFLNLIGVTDFTITEQQNSFTFDSETTFDSSVRRFDSKCECPTMTLEIETASLANDVRLLVSQLVPSIIDFMKPVSVKLDKALFYDLLITSNKPGLNEIIFTGSAQAVINWGDGTIQNFDTSLGTASHTYSSSDPRDITITFDDPDLVSKVDYQNSGVSYVFVRTTLLNNDTDFTVDLRNNEFTIDDLLQLFSDLLNYSDAQKTNTVIIDLRGSQILFSELTNQVRATQSELLSDHDIEVRVGGSFNYDFSLDFQTQ